MSGRITYLPNPFSLDKREMPLEVCRETGERYTIDEYIERLDVDREAFDLVVIDGDQIVKEYDRKPDSDQLIVRAVPKGDTKTAGQWTTLGGLALLFAGIVLLATGVGAPIGGGLIGTGISMMVTGGILFNVNIPKLEDLADPEVAPSIRGSKNRQRSGARIPILLGKHLIVPDVAALPYSEYDTDNQYLHQLFCAGYEEIDIDTGTIKIGDNPITNYTAVNYEEQRGQTAVNTYYPARTIDQSVGAKLTTDYVVRRTASNTRTLRVMLSFPQGLGHYDDNGDLENHSVSVRIEYSIADADSWSAVGATAELTYTDATAETVLEVESKTLDNLTAGGGDYSADRQYDVRVKLVAAPEDTSRYLEDCYWTILQSATGKFDGAGAVDTRPVVSGTQERLTMIGVRIKATDQLNGVIDSLSFVGELECREYSGSGSGTLQWTAAKTRNPAAMFLYVLQNDKINRKPVADANIDWTSLEAWWTFCDTKGFECNAYLSGDHPIEDLLNYICSTGRASWNQLDNKYTIIIDTTRATVSQYFTPRNSWGFVGSKAFADRPTTLKMQFIDADTGYVPVERLVSYNTTTGAIVYDQELAGLTQEVPLFGVTDPAHVAKLGAYMLAVTYLRPESFAFHADIEYLISTRGDRIQVTHDVPMFGLAFGRIGEVSESGGNTTGFVSDEYITFEFGVSYGVTIRLEDGTAVTKELINPSTGDAIATTDIVFASAIVGTGILNVEDMLLFGELGSETRDLIITQIAPGENANQARISCVDYSPDIFTADSGSIPTYDPGISKYAVSPENVVVKVPDPDQAAIDAAHDAGVDAAAAAAAQATANANQELSPPDPIAYWSCDDGEIGVSAENGDEIQDNSGNGHHGTIVGTPDYVAGKSGAALDLDGGTDRITVPHHTDFDFAGDFALACWASFDQATIADGEYLIDKYSNVTAKAFILRRNANEQINFDIRAAGDASWNSVYSNTTYSNDGWHHVVVVRSSGTVYLFIDTVLQTQTASNSTVLDGSQILGIGADGDGSNMLDGSLDEVAIFDQALTIEQIRWLYRHPGLLNRVMISGDRIVKRTITGDKVVDETITTSKIANAAIDGDKLALSAVDSTHVNVAEFEMNPGSSSLVAAYSFEEQEPGTEASSSVAVNDVSGNGHHGTITGTPGYVVGKAGGAISLDGSGDSITVPAHADFEFGSAQDFSVAIWTSDSVSGSRIDLVAYGTYDATASIHFRQNVSGLIVLRIRGASGTTGDIVSTSAVNDGALHHISVSVDRTGTGYFYIDGIQEASFDATVLGDMSSAENWYIGADESGTYLWNGIVDEFRLFNKALSAAEVQWLYHNPESLGIRSEPIDPGTEHLVAHWSLEDKPIGQSAAAGETINDVSGNGHEGTVAGTPEYLAGKAGSALDFDGTGDYIEGSDAGFPDGSQARSISLWFQMDSADTETPFAYGTNAAGERFGVAIDSTNDRIGIDMRTIYVHWNADKDLSAGGWHHAVITYSGGAINTGVVYLDNVLLSTIGASASPTTVAATVLDAFNIGRTLGGSQYLDGRIDEIRVYSKALTAAEVQFLYLNPGGSSATGINRSRVGAAELTSKHLRFGGAEIINEKGVEILETDELFPLDASGISSVGRIPQEQRCIIVPDKVFDHNEAGYLNGFAKGWNSDAWRMQTIGFWHAAENLVDEPEDLTGWTQSNCSAELLDEYFDNKQWTRVSCDSTSTGYIRKNIDISTGNCCIVVTVRRGSSSGAGDDTLINIFDFGGGNYQGSARIEWDTNSVSAVTATIFDAIWFGSDIVEVRFRVSCTISGTPAILIYPNENEAANEYVDVTAVLAEDSDWPSPYFAVSRPISKLWYRYQWPSDGYVDFMMFPRFSYDTVSNKYVISDYDSNAPSGNGYNIMVRYDQSLDQFTFTIRGASNTVTLTAGANGSGVWGAATAFTSNTDLHKWIHVELYYHSSNTIVLKINGTTIDSDATDPGVITFNNSLSIGSVPLYTTPDTFVFDGEITNLRIGSTSAGSHYAADAPWVDGYSMPNYANTVSIDRYSAKFNRAEISMVDRKGRLTNIGSAGIEQLDRDGNTIHDTPDFPLGVSLYAGHLYLIEKTIPSGSASASDSGTATYDTNLAEGWSNIDITDYIPPGLENVRCILASVRLTISWGGTAIAAKANFTNGSNPPSSAIAGCSFSDNGNITGSCGEMYVMASRDSGRAYVTLAHSELVSLPTGPLPVFKSGGSFYVRIGPYGRDFNNMTSNNFSWGVSASISIIGVYA